MGPTALLALEDGSLFHGISLGISGHVCGEVVFNTAMTGYQEIISDPSYAEQIITFTCPHIGNIGVNPQDMESKIIHAQAIVLKDYSAHYSNWRGESSLKDWLQQHGKLGIAGIDTRALTRKLREQGSLRGCLMAGEVDSEVALAKARAYKGLVGVNLAATVSNTRKTRVYESQNKATVNSSPHIVMMDYGVKQNIINELTSRGAKVTRVAANTSAQAVLDLNPDGVFLSNGPGDPRACTQEIATIKELLQHNLPMFGICLGHQLLSLASGAEITKMRVGHHGGNHPVQALSSKRVMITSQNHGFCVQEDNLPADIIITHRSLFDNTIQGIKLRERPVFGLQGHPEASPGPHDLQDCFQEFLNTVTQSESVKEAV